MKRNKTIYADDSTESIGLLLKLRLPTLIIGLILGALTTLVVARFEHVLESDVRLAFFIPFIVYLSGAVATQTETIYVRNMNRRNSRLSVYIFKEFVLGILLGGILGIAAFLGVYAWLDSLQIATTVGLALS